MQLRFCTWCNRHVLSRDDAARASTCPECKRERATMPVTGLIKEVAEQIKDAGGNLSKIADLLFYFHRKSAELGL